MNKHSAYIFLFNILFIDNLFLIDFLNNHTSKDKNSCQGFGMKGLTLNSPGTLRLLQVEVTLVSGSIKAARSVSTVPTKSCIFSSLDLQDKLE